MRNPGAIRAERDAAVMKALSIRQPWAWLIIHAGKDIENRTWMTRFRGRLLIHVSKWWSAATVARSLDALRDEGLIATMPPLVDLQAQRGQIIGAVDVVDSVRASGSPWFEGPAGLVLRNPLAIEPYEVTGALGLFNAREPKGWTDGS